MPDVARSRLRRSVVGRDRESRRSPCRVGERSSHGRRRRCSSRSEVVRRSAASRLASTASADVGEVAALLAVAVDQRRSPLEAGLEEARDDRGVGPVRVLPRAVHIEVAQADRLEARSAVERPWPPARRRLAGRIRATAVGLPRPRAWESSRCRRRRSRRRRRSLADAGLSGAVEDLHRPDDVDSAGRRRIFERARHRAEGRLMEDEIDTFAGPSAVRRLRISPSIQSIVEPDGQRFRAVAGGEVVEHPDPGAALDQRIHQMGADETGAPGDEDRVRRRSSSRSSDQEVFRSVACRSRARALGIECASGSRSPRNVGWPGARSAASSAAPEGEIDLLAGPMRGELADEDLRVPGLGDLLASKLELLVELLARPQTGVDDVDVLEGLSPERRIMSLASSVIETGSPMSRTRISPLRRWRRLEHELRRLGGVMK